MQVIQMTVGLLFDEARQNVLLQLKDDPEYLKGKWNGPGGKCFDNETPNDCIIRKFQEETDLHVPDLFHFARLVTANRMQDVQYHIHFYSAFSDCVYNFKDMTSEKHTIFDVYGLPLSVIPNLRWFIPMALHIQNDSADMMDVHECHSTWE